MVISIQTIAGHTLFSCTVGDLGHESGIGDVSLDSWACVEGMINCVKRTGHSSYYVEKGMGAMGKTPKQLGIQGAEYRIHGGGVFIYLLASRNEPLTRCSFSYMAGGASLESLVCETQATLFPECALLSNCCCSLLFGFIAG